MLIKKSEDIKSSEITTENHYLNRRNFIRGAALAATLSAGDAAVRRVDALHGGHAAALLQHPDNRELVTPAS